MFDKDKLYLAADNGAGASGNGGTTPPEPPEDDDDDEQEGGTNLGSDPTVGDDAVKASDNQNANAAPIKRSGIRVVKTDRRKPNGARVLELVLNEEEDVDTTHNGTVVNDETRHDEIAKGKGPVHGIVAGVDRKGKPNGKFYNSHGIEVNRDGSIKNPDDDAVKDRLRFLSAA